MVLRTGWGRGRGLGPAVWAGELTACFSASAGAGPTRAGRLSVLPVRWPVCCPSSRRSPRWVPTALDCLLGGHSTARGRDPPRSSLCPDSSGGGGLGSGVSSTGRSSACGGHLLPGSPSSLRTCLCANPSSYEDTAILDEGPDGLALTSLSL